VVGERRGLGPKFQDDLERLARHVSILARHPIDIEHRPVARQARSRDAKVQPAVGEVIKYGHAVRKLGWMMIRQQEAARAEPDVFGLPQALDDEEIRRGMRLPGRGVMLADPAFLIAELVEPAQHLQIKIVTLFHTALRRMRRHRKISEFHDVSSSLLFFRAPRWVAARLFEASKVLARVAAE